MQNVAASVFISTGKRDHISPDLASLHWLPVEMRIQFKILLMSCKALNGLAPSYLKNIIVPHQPTHVPLSQSAGLITVPSVQLKKTM